MLVYQVTVTVDTAREAAWRAWMADHHIADVLATGYFRRAEFVRHQEDDGGNPRFVIRYYAASQAALDAYQNGPAAALKADHNDRFPGLPAVRRDLFEVLAHGSAEPSAGV